MDNGPDWGDLLEGLKIALSCLTTGLCAVLVAIATFFGILAHLLNICTDKLLGRKPDRLLGLDTFTLYFRESVMLAFSPPPLTKEDLGVETVIGGNPTVDS